VVGVFPNPAAPPSVSSEPCWPNNTTNEGRRYLGLDVLTRARAALTSSDQTADQQPSTTPALTA
jgi:putative transposase